MSPAERARVGDRARSVAPLLITVATLVTMVAAGCTSGTDSSARPSDATVHIVSQNLLHGTACPPASDRCHLPARVDLFVRQLADAGCPPLVSAQEANERTVELLRDSIAHVCDDAYRVVWDDDPSLDREVVLTTERVLGSQRIRLAGPLRTALWVRVATEVGVVDYVSSHLASSSDDRPCDAATCPPPCEAADSLNTCQARQVVQFAEQQATPDSVVVLGGDLNARPDEPTVAAITDAGFVDTHLMAGKAECEPETGTQCTSGRIDDALTDLRDPTSTQSERIDYLFVAAQRDCSVVEPTGIFNSEPADGALAYPSDHTGVQATLRCPTTPAQLDAAANATVATEATTTTAAATTADVGTVAAITDAYANLFDGSVTDVEVKLDSLEHADELRPFFLDSYEATRDVAAGIRVRIDAIDLVDPTHADVTYTLLLDGSAVLDHLPGSAVEVDGRWLVTLRTYCDVSTQGAETIPEPCR